MNPKEKAEAVTVECPGCSEMTHHTKLFADPRGFEEKICAQCIQVLEGEARRRGIPIDSVRM